MTSLLFYADDGSPTVVLYIAGLVIFVAVWGALWGWWR